MFTGIIQGMGTVAAIEPGDAEAGDVRLEVAFDAAAGAAGLALGDSVAVSGVCLTVVEQSDNAFCADVSKETLSLTTLGELAPGAPVNLERALTLSTPLGGHLVSGHVDGLGNVTERADDARSVRFRFSAPRALERYIAPKGSVCVDGISLTVNRVEGREFEVNVVPHTLQVTTMHAFNVGRRVNLEVDLIARYLERLLEARDR